MAAFENLTKTNNNDETESDLNSQTVEKLISANQINSNLSRNQQKKLLRLEKAAKFKAEKRKKERERRKLKGNINLCIKESANGEVVKCHRKSLKSNLMSNSKNKLRIVIDCSFENLMNDSDIHHLGKQLAYCYAKNRRMESPLQFYITSCSEKTFDFLEKSGLSNWDIYLHKDKHYLDVFNQELKENICYLTSESPNELNEFDEKKIYIIGGLVDHNHKKSYCYDLAIKNGLSHAHLPINKYMNMKTRQVLTVNHVFEIICKFTETKDWKRAFISTLPKRKGAEALTHDKNDNQIKVVENTN